LRHHAPIVLALTICRAVLGQSAGPIPGAPFSANQVIIRTRAGADGKSVETRESRRVFRDSLGRTREDMTPGLSPTPEMEPLVLIRGPVAGVIYALETPSQTAHRWVIPKPPNGGPAMGFSYGIPFPANNGKPDQFPKGRPTVKSESLGTRTIQGIDAQGFRTTMTWSAESQGTERDVVSVDERWMSELGMALLLKHSDGSSGTAVMQLENIRREEPDASLFVVPAEYQIVDLH
jgi:hypothetical protein